MSGADGEEVDFCGLPQNVIRAAYVDAVFWAEETRKLIRNSEAAAAFSKALVLGVRQPIVVRFLVRGISWQERLVEGIVCFR